MIFKEFKGRTASCGDSFRHRAHTAQRYEEVYFHLHLSPSKYWNLTRLYTPKSPVGSFQLLENFSGASLMI